VWLSIAIDLSLRSLFLVYRFKNNIKTLDNKYQNL